MSQYHHHIYSHDINLFYFLFKRIGINENKKKKQSSIDFYVNAFGIRMEGRKFILLNNTRSCKRVIDYSDI